MTKVLELINYYYYLTTTDIIAGTQRQTRYIVQLPDLSTWIRFQGNMISYLKERKNTHHQSPLQNRIVESQMSSREQNKGMTSANMNGKDLELGRTIELSSNILAKQKDLLTDTIT